ncbi:MAG: phage integrase N-terminal SAM-like domain-containing protein [Saprospiraceae bacterium]|jgi:site-specific recombinase XerD|nr:phage integrase N-terminal SAM-like domain-containing protein [Saprospiraceae bacterium]
MERKQHQYVTQFEDWMTLRNYSPKTIKCYTCAVRKFWEYCENRRGDSDFIKADAPQIYLLYRYREQQVAWQTINALPSASGSLT